MKCNAPFHSIRDAVMRLDGTICFYNEEPFFVQIDSHAPDKNCACLYKISSISTGEHTLKKRVDYTDEFFSYLPKPLGYINSRSYGKCFFLTKRPRRSQKQGIHSRNILMTACSQSSFRSISSDLYFSKDMEDCLNNKYCSYNECLSCLETGNVESWAFNKNFCIGKVSRGFYGLYHRNNLVGSVNLSDGRINLLHLPELKITKKYLDEVLKEEGVSINVQ